VYFFICSIQKIVLKQEEKRRGIPKLLPSIAEQMKNSARDNHTKKKPDPPDPGIFL